MNTPASGKARKKPVVLTKGFEDILKAVNFYRYMTAMDVAHLLFSPSALVRVRSRLTELSGGDFVDGEYLYRLRLASVPRGNPERIYTLGAKGRDFLENVLGVPVPWHFRPSKVKHFGFNVVLHNLILTRFLVAASRFAALAPEFRLSQVRICYELGGLTVPVEIETEGEREKVSVIPDGWLMFEGLKEGRHAHWFPVLLEIDRGTMYRERFKRHVRSRIEFVERGEYRRIFGTEAVVVAYAATGPSGELSEGRRSALCAWTMEALREAGREDWANVFRFCSLSFGEIYASPLFDGRVWYRPDDLKPVRLFGG
jgi:hypothetical protein